MKRIIIMLIVLISMSVQAQEVKCRAYTNAGKVCMRKVAKEGYCKQHYTMKTGKVIPNKPKIDLPEEWPAMSTDSNKPSLMVAWRDPVTNIIHLGYKH